MNLRLSAKDRRAGRFLGKKGYLTGRKEDEKSDQKGISENHTTKRYDGETGTSRLRRRRAKLAPLTQPEMSDDLSGKPKIHRRERREQEKKGEEEWDKHKREDRGILSGDHV